ncbi:hypothetical protein CLOM_g3622 [Closterium sp. NIES-68]|nr:hypothetical protein CLOM_g3622 [Closterium sp. NIES-68]GJP63688.1 hypothetical protein CLOP_g20747 [Closterium sp. NIES-67]
MEAIAQDAASVAARSAAPSMPPSTGGEAIQPARRFSKAPDFWLLTPILYAPAFPLIRITLRHRPKLRDRLFVTAVASAFLHGAYMNYRFYNAESYQQSQREVS